MRLTELLYVSDGSSQGVGGPQVEGKADNSQEIQQFTDIPLDVSENPGDNKPPTPAPLPNKAEESLQSFGLRSIIPSFVPLLVPQSFKNISGQEPEVRPSSVENNVSKRISTPETVVPQLITPPPTSSQKKVLQDIPPAPSVGPIPRVPPLAEPPPSVSPPSLSSLPPPPSVANITRAGNVNPYALNRAHSSLSTASFPSFSNPSVASYFVPAPVTDPSETSVVESSVSNSPPLVNSVPNTNNTSTLSTLHNFRDSGAVNSPPAGIPGASQSGHTTDPNTKVNTPVPFPSSPVGATSAPPTVIPPSASQVNSQSFGNPTVPFTPSFVPVSISNLLTENSPRAPDNNSTTTNTSVGPPSVSAQPVSLTSANSSSAAVLSSYKITPENTLTPSIGFNQKENIQFKIQESASPINTSTSPAPPPQTQVAPPSVSNVPRAGSENPYTLKGSHHSQSPSNTKQGSVIQSVSSGEYPFFTPTDQNPQKASSFNLLSGPQIGSGSETKSQPETDSVKKSDIDNLRNIPFVQSLTSSISNFISPNKTSDDINKNVSGPSSSSIDFLNNYSHANDINKINQYPPTLSQPQIYQTYYIQNPNDLNANQVPPPGPLFNTSNIINNNLSGLGTPGLAQIPPIDNTICVSAITTALSSVAPAPGIQSYHSHSTRSSNEVTPTAPPLENQTSHFTYSGFQQPQQAPDLFNNNNNLLSSNTTDNQAVSSHSVTSSLNSTNFTENTNHQSEVDLGSSQNIQGTSYQPSCSDFPQTQVVTLPSPLSEQEVTKAVSDRSSNQPDSNPVIQPIPTFNYFSEAKGSSLPPPVDQSSVTKRPVSELPTTSFFKPIEGPNTFASSFPSHNPTHVGGDSRQASALSNPFSTAPVSFPPPNISCPPKSSAPETVSTPKSELSGPQESNSVSFHLKMSKFIVLSSPSGPLLILLLTLTGRLTCI